MLNYHNSQCYCITGESDRQILLTDLCSILLDIELECSLEGTDHPVPTKMNVQIISPKRKTDEALILEKISGLVWKHRGSVEL